SRTGISVKYRRLFRSTNPIASIPVFPFPQKSFSTPRPEQRLNSGMTRSFLIAAGSVFAFAATVSADLQRFHFSGPHMGTMVRITAFAPNSVVAESAARQAFDRIAELNRILSDYDPESELSHLSQAAP